MRAFIATLILLTVVVWAQAQEDPKPGQPLPPGAERTASGKLVYRGRLPNGFGKLGITYDQKQNIYKVMAEYDAKIDELEKQVAALREQKTAAIMNLLSDRQKEMLNETAGSTKDAPAKSPAGEKAD